MLIAAKLNLIMIKNKSLLPLVEVRLLNEERNPYFNQGLKHMTLPTVAIVGRPNVGKSTLFNRIAGERISIVEDVEGVTRDRIYTSAEWLNRQFSLIDTGGIDDVDAPFMEQIKHQADIAMTEADVIVFVVSGKEGVTDADEYVARILYKTNKPVILAVNKEWITLRCVQISMISILLVLVIPIQFHLFTVSVQGMFSTLSLKTSQQKLKKKIQISSVSV